MEEVKCHLERHITAALSDSSLCYNFGAELRRYRLGVRTEDSQSSNTGSIPVSATKLLRPAGLHN
jgi:hypothetical protein